MAAFPGISTMTDRLLMVMPNISEFQHAQRTKLLLVRDFANARLVQTDPPYHAHQLYIMVGEIVNGWIFTPMEDEVLKRVVDHCRALVKAAGEAEWLFQNEGREP